MKLSRTQKDALAVIYRHGELQAGARDLYNVYAGPSTLAALVARGLLETEGRVMGTIRPVTLTFYRLTDAGRSSLLALGAVPSRREPTQARPDPGGPTMK